MLYDPSKTFEENVANGPFDIEPRDYRDASVGPQYTFLGYPINFPFGIAAGSLPSSKHTDAAFRLGYDVVVYKTKRSGTFPCNPFPNVLPLQIDGNLTLERLKQPIKVAKDFDSDLSKLSITNSFGVPSDEPDEWGPDVTRAIQGAGRGQLLIMSVLGIIREGKTEDEYYQDFATAAQAALRAGAEAIEVNLSCPNVVGEGIVCYTRRAVYEICKRTKAAIGDAKLIMKVGYYAPEQQQLLEDILADVSPYISAVSAINTLQGTIVNEHGQQALSGKGRSKSGVCGAGIKWAGLDMVERLNALRQKEGYAYEIIGVGGVMTPADFAAYRTAGADVVMTVTAAMWNPLLAQQVKAAVARSL